MEVRVNRILNQSGLSLIEAVVGLGFLSILSYLFMSLSNINLQGALLIDKLQVSSYLNHVGEFLARQDSCSLNFVGKQINLADLGIKQSSGDFVEGFFVLRAKGWGGNDPILLAKDMKVQGFQVKDLSLKLAMDNTVPREVFGEVTIKFEKLNAKGQSFSKPIILGLNVPVGFKHNGTGAIENCISSKPTKVVNVPVAEFVNFSNTTMPDCTDFKKPYASYSLGCHRYCMLGCTSEMPHCTGDQRGLGFGSGVATECDLVAKTVTCSCLP